MQQVEIRLQGHLDHSWGEWLDGFTFTHTGEGETILSGLVLDQTAMYGLIAKLRDLGVTILALSMGETSG